MSKKKETKNNIIEKKYETFFITIILLFFFIGYFVGWSYSDSTLTKTEIELEKTRLDLRSFSQSLLFIDSLNETLCDPVQITLMNEKLFNVATELDNLEQKGLAGDGFYELLKEKYNVNQVLFYTYYREYSNQCENSSHMILFFFNSSEPEMAKKQGMELDKLVEENDVIILPMDYDYSENLDYFYRYYNTTNLPTLILDYETRFVGLTQAELIQKSLN